MSPAYPLNAPPDARCDCGPALGICTHALVPLDIREIQVRHLPHLAPTNPAGTNPVAPAANPAADTTNNEGTTNV